MNLERIFAARSKLALEQPVRLPEPVIQWPSQTPESDARRNPKKAALEAGKTIAELVNDALDQMVVFTMKRLAPFKVASQVWQSEWATKMRASCLLEIPSDKNSVRLTDRESGNVLFEGNERQAWRIANILPPIVGSNTHYLRHNAQMTIENGVQVFVVPSDFDLESEVIIRIFDGEIKSVSVVWP